LDILEEKASDPQWLVKQRQAEVDIIEKWIAKYQADLSAFKQHIPI
jgi:lysosomal Pro-X carboxypeptidase